VEPDGIVLVDKPKSMTSFDVVRVFKRHLGRVKVGHCGTLDPLATGLLPICIGRATKLMQFIVAGIKNYTGRMVLGVRTDTFDIEGRIVEQRAIRKGIDLEMLEETARKLTGEIEQVPPPFSAVKYRGKPLYALARRGIMLKKEPRKVKVERFDITGFEAKRFVDFDISCSKGTYVRSLIDEFGQLLGCCAYLKDLRRTIVGPFSIDNALSLEAIEDFLKKGRLKEILVAREASISHIPAIHVETELARAISRGMPLDKTYLDLLIDKRGIKLNPAIPYLRITSSGDNLGPTTIAIANWPHESFRRKVKMARVLT